MTDSESDNPRRQIVKRDDTEKWAVISLSAALIALFLMIAAIEVSKNLRPPAQTTPGDTTP